MCALARPQGATPAAQRPRDEPPGQLSERITNPIRRSWPGRLHRVVRPLASWRARCQGEARSAIQRKARLEFNLVDAEDVCNGIPEILRGWGYPGCGEDR